MRHKDTFLYNTGSDHRPRQQLVESQAVLFEVTRIGRTDGRGARGWLPRSPARPATWARSPRRTMPSWLLARSTPCPAGARSSRVNGGRALTSTWARSSTSATCGRSSELHAASGSPSSSAAAPGVNTMNDLNVHSIAIGVPITAVTRSRTPDHRRVDLGEPPAGPERGRRQRPERASRAARARSRGSAIRSSTRCSCRWATRTCGTPCRPMTTSCSRRTSPTPRLAALLPVLYPGMFPHLAALVASGKPRGRPGGDPAHRHPGRHHPRIHQLHRAGARRHAAAEHLHRAHAGRQAEHLRPARRRRGRLPERRRVTNDVTAIELRAITGVTLRAGRQELHPRRRRGRNNRRRAHPRQRSAPRYLDVFPYLGVPYSGYDNPS